MNERGYEPCPFCGSEDVWGTFYAPMEHLVFCGECGAKIMGATSYDEAKKLWNRRSTDQWIPCKDRLPEKVEKRYWVSLDTGGQCECRWTDNILGLSRGRWGWSIFDHPQYTKVMAWRQLPEPYKEE